MDGPNADRLRLILKHNQMIHQLANDTILLVPRYETLWEGRSDSGDQWLTGSVLYSHGQSHQVDLIYSSSQFYIPRIYSDFQKLTFEAVVDNAVQVQRRLRGHFVLDNVDLGVWKEREKGNPINESTDTLMIDPCLGHCNFDGGFCGWSNDPDDDFDWSLV